MRTSVDGWDDAQYYDDSGTPAGPKYGSCWTVGELKDELDKYPNGLRVATEGCDCLGDVRGVHRMLGEFDGFLLLSRLPQPDTVQVQTL